MQAKGFFSKNAQSENLNIAETEADPDEIAAIEDALDDLEKKLLAQISLVKKDCCWLGIPVLPT